MRALLIAGVAMAGFMSFSANAQDNMQNSDPNAAMPKGDVPSNTGMVPADPYAQRDPMAPVGSSANPVTMGGNMTSPPTDAKKYPVCSKTVTDSCINRSEARHTKHHRK